MAQKRHTEYLSDDDSFQFNSFLIGLIPSGLYRGFEFNPTSNLFLELNHTTTGYIYPKKDGTISPKIGVLRSKQGVLITEDAPITLQVSANTTANPRIDLVICEHKYEEIAGGLDAEYFVIEGTPNANPVIPTLTNPNFQVVIGQLYLPAGTSVLDANGVIYTRSQLPELGNNNLQEQQNILQQNFNALQQNFNTLQSNFDTLNQTMIDWRTYYRPVMQFDGVYIEWKWFGEADLPSVWRDLAQGIVVDCSGPGTMEVRILEAQYLPTAQVWNLNNPEQRDHNVLEFNTQISVPDATYWINNREWIAPQTKDYQILLDTMHVVCYKEVDYTAMATANIFPFPVFGDNGTNGHTQWWEYQENPNGFVRIELVKNGTQVVHSMYHKFDILDGAQVGDSFLLPVIDIIISATAGDAFLWRVTTMPNFNVEQERVYSFIGVYNEYYHRSTVDRQANTAWVQREHFQIESGHWTVFGM